MKNLSQNKENPSFQGKYRITKLNPLTGAILSQSEWYKNIVVSSNGYGRNLIGRQMVGDTTYPIVIDEMSLSTNSTAPTDADTSLGGTEVDVPVELLTITDTGESNIITFSGFFTDIDLPNGTYSKVGVKMTNRIFTSALLDIAIVKDTDENYRIDYQITIN